MNLSFNVSRNFVQRLRWLSKTVIQERDLNSIKSYLTQIKDDDIVFLFSLSGKSKYILNFAHKIPKNVYVIGLLGTNNEIDKFCDVIFKIPQFEAEMWDSFSIRGQCLIQILDFLYMDLTNSLVGGVQKI